MATEWEDIQRRFGNLPPTEVVIEEEVFGDIIDEAAENHESRFDHLDEAAVLDLEDSQQDDRAFEEYRRRRLDQLRREAHESYGSLISLNSRDAFTKQVSEAPTNVWVVALLDKDRQRESEILQQALLTLSRKFIAIKFTRISAQTCIPNYPVANTPTILVYRNGQVVKQFIGLAPFGGWRLTPNDLEWELAALGAVSSDLEENPHISTTDRIYVNILKK